MVDPATLATELVRLGSRSPLTVSRLAAFLEMEEATVYRALAVAPEHVRAEFGLERPRRQPSRLSAFRLPR
jgi:hypothetical protein